MSVRPGAGVTLPNVVKFLAPEAFASAIIGKGGAAAEDIRTSTNTKLGLTDRGQYYPNTVSRVVTLQGSSENDLVQAMKLIVAKLEESKINPAEATAEQFSLTEPQLQMLLPTAAVGGLIGKSGSKVQTLREQSGAKVSFSGEKERVGATTEQIVTVTGVASAIDVVVETLIHAVQELCSQTWFPTWASMTLPAQAAPSMSSSVAWPPGVAASPMAQSLPPGIAAASPGGGMDLVIGVAQTLPSYVTQDPRGFQMNCTVPKELLGGLIGKGGAGLQEVTRYTGCRIEFREIADNPDKRTMTISGPLGNACAAYMLMMKRHIDCEAQESSWAQNAGYVDPASKGKGAPGIAKGKGKDKGKDKGKGKV